LRQIEGPFFIGDIAIPSWLPRPLKQLGWKILDRYKLDPMMRKGLENVRQEWQLPALEGSYLERWMHSPDTGIALWPTWFDSTKHLGQYQAPLQTGFVFLDESIHTGAPLSKSDALSPAIEAFLNDGPPPLVWMPGSAVRKPQLFFEHAMKVSASLKCRAILLTNDNSYAPKNLSKDHLVHSLTPFAQLLPRCQALIHHGGIGSAAQAIRAGIPQVIIASAFDQFFNGHRIQTLGLGTWCTQKSANSQIIEKKLCLALELPKAPIKHYQAQVLQCDNAQVTYQVLIDLASAPALTE
jgi:rhamnosyltransferase subunit B